MYHGCLRLTYLKIGYHKTITLSFVIAANRNPSTDLVARGPVSRPGGRGHPLPHRQPRQAQSCAQHPRPVASCCELTLHFIDLTSGLAILLERNSSILYN